MSPVIRISQPIYERLQSIAEPFTDTPASVIEKLLDVYDQQSTAKPKAPETSGVASPITEEMPDEIPDTLNQVLRVSDLVWNRGKTYNEAVVLVSKQINVEPNTVRDKCTRLISIKGKIKIDTALFLDFLDNRNKMAEHLKLKFPHLQHIIESKILGLDNKLEEEYINQDYKVYDRNMTTLKEIWRAMENHMPTGTIFGLEEIYSIVEKHCALTDEDFEPQAPDSSIPKWKRNVRNVLQKKKGIELDWVGRGLYKRI